MATLDLAALEDSVFTIVSPLVSPGVLIMEDQDGPRPQGAYATMKLLTINQVGLPQISEPDATTLLVTAKAHYEVVMRFTGFRDTAKNITSNLNFDLINNPGVLDSFSAIGLEQFNSPVVSDIPVFRDTEWEQQSSTSLSYYMSHEETIDLSTIDTVNWFGTIFNTDGSIAIVIGNVPVRITEDGQVRVDSEGNRRTVVL